MRANGFLAGIWAEVARGNDASLCVGAEVSTQLLDCR